MTDDERKGMEKDENDAVFNELIKEVGWVFWHPILREWVKASPSVNSIDQWVSRQFSCFDHKLDLIKAMRKAVKAWRMINNREVRENILETPKGWRLADMFVFDEKTKYPGIYSTSNPLDFVSGIKFLPNESKTISCNHWPRFLREFGEKVGPDGFKTSFDEHGTRTGHFYSPESGLDEEFWYKSRVSESVRTRPNELNELGYKLDYKQKSSMAWFKMIFEKFGIDSQIVQIAPEGNEIYPRFYKVVYLHELNAFSDPEVAVKVIWPIDCSGDQQVGRVIFSKFFRLHDHIKVILEMSYRFGSSFKLIPDPEHLSYEHHSLIKFDISSVQQSLLFQTACPVPDTAKATGAIEDLFPLFIKIWDYSIKSGTEGISLESILGDAFFQNKDRDLLSVFTGVRAK